MSNILKPQVRDSNYIVFVLLFILLILKVQTPKFSASRRRPTIVRALSSSTIHDKFDILLSKRIEVADLEQKKLTIEIENCQKEHSTRMETLKLDIELKKEQLKRMKM